MKGKWVVSQEDLGAGRWIVHHPGGNRPHKMGYCTDREHAELLVTVLNHLEDQVEHWRGLARAGALFMVLMTGTYIAIFVMAGACG